MWPQLFTLKGRETDESNVERREGDRYPWEIAGKLEKGPPMGGGTHANVKPSSLCERHIENT